MMNIVQDIKRWRFWRYFLSSSFTCLGIIGTILQTLNVIKPTVTVYQGSNTLIGVVIVSALIGLAKSWPSPIAQEYNAPNTKISIVKGDILSEKGNIVIGTNDTFDTETPHIIDVNSLQGQALRRLYGDDRNELDRQLADALSGKNVVGTINKPGRQSKYGVGTVVTLSHLPRLIFFLAYCEMSESNNASSSPDKIWKSLNNL